MVSLRSLPWLSRRLAFPRNPWREVLPSLEVLEDRTVPNNMAFQTITDVTNVATTYDLTHQFDRVSVLVRSRGGAGAPLGEVQVTDGNQTQDVTLAPVEGSTGSGSQATALFTFNLFKNAMPGEHSVSASYPGGEDQSANVLGSSSSLPFTAPDTTKTYENILFIDLAIVLLLAQQGN